MQMQMKIIKCKCWTLSRTDFSPIYVINMFFQMLRAMMDYSFVDNNKTNPSCTYLYIVPFIKPKSARSSDVNTPSFYVDGCVCSASLYYQSNLILHKSSPQNRLIVFFIAWLLNHTLIIPCVISVIAISVLLRL